MISLQIAEIFVLGISNLSFSKASVFLNIDPLPPKTKAFTLIRRILGQPRSRNHRLIDLKQAKYFLILLDEATSNESSERSYVTCRSRTMAVSGLDGSTKMMSGLIVESSCLIVGSRKTSPRVLR